MRSRRRRENRGSHLPRRAFRRWASRHADGLPEYAAFGSLLKRITRVTSISGLHDLRPLMRIAANEKLRIDSAEALAESPVLQEPLPGMRVACAVGAEERPEFLRQNDLLANIWFGLEAKTSSLHIAGTHHFNVVDGMRSRDSALSRLMLGED